MTDRFQGDPKIYISENGAYLDFRGGQPVMDQGFENAMLFSLHTREGWVGNAFLTEDSQKIGSRYEVEHEKEITISNLNRRRNAALEALNWFIEQKIASSVDAFTQNTVENQVETVTLVKPISKDPLILSTTKYGANWIAQSVDPANLK